MILNLFYSVFFGMVNLLIYLKLEKKFKLKFPKLIYILIVIISLAHIEILNKGFLKSFEDFFNLSFFSIALIIFHYMTNIQVAVFKRKFIPENETGQKLQEMMLTAFDFMRQKLIYPMAYITQLMEIWDK